MVYTPFAVYWWTEGNIELFRVPSPQSQAMLAMTSPVEETPPFTETWPQAATAGG